MIQSGVVGALLAQGSVDRYRPLGAFGKPAYQSHFQLRAALLARLGPRYANYFARPTFDVEKRELRWNAEASGEPRRWRELTDEQRSRVAQSLQQIRDGLMAYVGELRDATRNNQSGGGQALASLLEQAMTVPDDEHLHVIGDQPILSFWGFERQSYDTAAAAATLAAAPPAIDIEPPGPIAAPDTPRPALVPPVPVDERQRHPWAWLRWLLALLLLLLLCLLLTWWMRCRWPVADWLIDLGWTPTQVSRFVDCPRIVPITPPVVVAPPPVQPHETPPVEPPVVRPDAVAPPVDPRKMAIPEAATRQRDLSFLKGRWELGPRMTEVRPDGKVVGEMINTLQFDDKGHGFIQSQAGDGQGGECRGPAKAWFDQDVLRIETDTCSGQRRDINGFSLECRRAADGRSLCQGMNKGEQFRGSRVQRFEVWLRHPE